VLAAKRGVHRGRLQGKGGCSFYILTLPKPSICDTTKADYRPPPPREKKKGDTRLRSPLTNGIMGLLLDPLTFTSGHNFFFLRNEPIMSKWLHFECPLYVLQKITHLKKYHLLFYDLLKKQYGEENQIAPPCLLRETFCWIINGWLFVSFSDANLGDGRRQDEQYGLRRGNRRVGPGSIPV